MISLEIFTSFLQKIKLRDITLIVGDINIELMVELSAKEFYLDKMSEFKSPHRVLYKQQ